MDEKETKELHPDRWERLGFGLAIIGGLIIAIVALLIGRVPAENSDLLGLIIGGLVAGVGQIVSQVFKTGATERQQTATMGRLVETMMERAHGRVAGSGGKDTKCESVVGTGGSVAAPELDPVPESPGIPDTVIVGADATDAIPDNPPDGVGTAPIAPRA